MAQRSRFQAPRAVSDFPTVQRALTEIQQSLDAATRSRAMLKVYTADFSLVAGGFHRVSAQLGRTVNARLPAASGANLSEPVTLHLEGMQGTVRVAAAPGQLVNGQPYATFDVDGVVTLWSNGVSAWTGVAQLPAESPGGAALDAEYVLGAAHGSLPSGRVATASAEITPDVATPGIISWVLNAGSVALSKLANLAGLSVLGRSANSAGVMAAITATSSRQALMSNAAGDAIGWRALEAADEVSTWANVLARGATSGASDPTIDSGQHITFTGPTSDTGGDIQALGDLTLSSATDMHLHAGANLHLGHVGDTVEVHIEADGAIEGLTPGLIDFQAGTTFSATATANASMTSGADAQVSGALVRLVTASTARLTIQNDGSWTVNGTDGAAGMYLRSFGAAATPQWAVISVGEISGLSAVTGAVSHAASGGASTFSGIRDNGTLETARSFINFVAGTNTTVALTQDAVNDEIEVAVSVTGITSSGAVTGAVTIAAGGGASQFANIQEAGVQIGSPRDALNFVSSGTATVAVSETVGPPSRANVSFSVNQGASYTWTGNHSWSSVTFRADASGDILLNSTAEGLGLAAGFTVSGVTAGDILVNASSGIGIFAGHAAAETSVTDGDISVGGFLGLALTAGVAPITNVASGVLIESSTIFRLVTNGTERLEVESDGAWQLGGNTGTLGQTIVSAGSAAPPVWGAPAGALLRVTRYTSGSALTHTWLAGATQAIIDIVSSGGGGGSVANPAAAQCTLGGGGCSGTWVRALWTIDTATATYTVGAAAAGGASGNLSSFTDGTDTISCPGGSVGGALASGTSLAYVLGGSAGALSATFTGSGFTVLNHNGGTGTLRPNAGGHGLRHSGTVAMSGFGAPSPFSGGGSGAGRQSSGVGAAGAAPGAGGGGACSFNAGGAFAGGASLAGIIVIYEYA